MKKITKILLMIIILETIGYWMFMPILWFITNNLISSGMSAETSLYYIHLAQWGFIIFAIILLIFLILGKCKLHNKIFIILTTLSPILGLLICIVIEVKSKFYNKEK